VLMASEKATPDSADYQVAIASNGECSMTSSSGFAASTANIVSYLRFEEGPCDADIDKDAERERVVLAGTSISPPLERKQTRRLHAPTPRVVCTRS
jgi:hypothetical protein